MTTQASCFQLLILCSFWSPSHLWRDQFLCSILPPNPITM